MTGTTLTPPVAIDRRALLAWMDGDLSLLRELVQIFLDEAPRNLRQLRTALTRGDANGMRLAAHTLSGNSSNFGGNAVSELARRLEKMGRAGDLAGVGDILDDLEVAMDALCRGLSDLSEHS